MLDELSSFTLEAIAGVYFGDYASPDLIGDVKRYMRDISSGLFSLPVKIPWPINKLAVLSFGKSMNARAALSGDVRRVLGERRADLLSAGGASSGTGGKSAGVLDSLIGLQQEQGGTFDDDFIVDMVRVGRQWPEDGILALCSVLHHRVLACKPINSLPALRVRHRGRRQSPNIILSLPSR